MKMRFSKRAWIFAACMLFSISHNDEVVLAQSKQDDATIRCISSFLNDSGELSNYSRNGFTSQFTKELRPISEELRTELKGYFPEYEFHIAKMDVLIDPPSSKYDLILLFNVPKSEIEGFVWANYWTIRPSDSFESILKGHKARSEENAVDQVKSLGKLIVFANGDKIGKTRFKKGKVTVELIRGEGVQGILNVTIDKDFIFHRITITKPNGERLRYFV